MKRMVGMRSPGGESMELRRGERKRQPNAHTWDTPTNASAGGGAAAPRRFFADGTAAAGGGGGGGAGGAGAGEGGRGGRASSSGAGARGGGGAAAASAGSGSGGGASCDDPWTEEEDAVLREGVLRFGTNAWEDVSRHLLPPVSGGPQKRKAGDCEARWEAVVRHTAVEGGAARR